ncbi:flagellar export protein FliJ [Buchnera aphidicola (Hyperomyzus lactucae)]|uniref:Flagellar FliJ protein n=1 Tax=Buchnera aphidicola (Hyperomyzus lactucae) TaxID=1241860 RepID=A0A4D6Y473_9GAMM|nr:flagellar FliJ family protein [Buchnera aphidicola]QCI20820.1 flagellar export protein FliJ [Buchnera aphidicola (Hyperomyzus lactucae)]
MKYKKNLFSILENIEQKKIEKEIINIKNLYMQKKQNNKQLNLLSDYQKEYVKKIDDYLRLGVFVYHWKDYNNFILLLDVIIKDNINIIKKNQRIIQESLQRWFNNEQKLKIWKHLHKKSSKHTLKVIKIKEQAVHDNYTQLKFFKKDNYYNVKSYL